MNKYLLHWSNVSKKGYNIFQAWSCWGLSLELFLASGWFDFMCRVQENRPCDLDASNLIVPQWMGVVWCPLVSCPTAIA